MTRANKITVKIILTAIIGIFAFASFVDLSRFFGMYDFYNRYPNDLIKRLSVLLAAALVWLAGKGSLGKGDNRIMKLLFLIICIGEYFFLIAKPAFAIIAFFVCQYMLIIRHSKDLFKGLCKASASQKLKLTIAAVVLASIIIFTAVRLYPFGSYYDLSILALVYWLMLSMSLWTALANRSLSLLPKINSKMIATGMICFYFCDICVGLDGILDGGTVWMLANSLIWVFYTPAITLLALSCYKYEDRSPINKIALDKTRALK